MKKILNITLALLLTAGSPVLSFADVSQVDKLINKLVEKGILNKEEAMDLKQEIAADEKIAQEEAVKQGLPDWVKNAKLSGDFRLRHEYTRSNSNDVDRSRGRIRYRLGVETNVNDQTKVAAGLASNGSGTGTTGGNRSTNTTFSNTFDKTPVVLDYAYAEFTPYNWLKLTGGKMKIPFWEPGDLLWDTDITPEGGALAWNWQLNNSLKLFTNVDAFVLDEQSTAGSDPESDPFMLILQPGFEWKPNSNVDYKFAFGYNSFDNGAKQTLDNRGSTNTVTGGRYDFTYNTIFLGHELGLNKPFGLPIARLAAIGEFIHNPDPDDNNNGWLAGVYFGDKKVAGPNQWKMSWTYRSLGKDAWLDALPDSDFYGGNTDVRGLEGILEYGLAKNVWLALDYYRTERITANKAIESILQTDLNFKF